MSIESNPLENQNAQVNALEAAFRNDFLKMTNGVKQLDDPDSFAFLNDIFNSEKYKEYSEDAKKRALEKLRRDPLLQ